jgi:hypothetical protein
LITKKSLAIIMTAVTVGLLSMLGLSLVSAQEGPSANRSFDTASVAPEGQVVVTITATGYGQAGGVTETLPEGFTYVSSDLPANQVTEIGQQQVRFTLFGDDSFTYTVTVSSTGGDYQFSGMLRDDDRMNHTVGGDTTVTVEMDAPEPEPEPTPGDEQEQDGQDPSASRSIPPASVAPGGRVVVTITADNYGQAGGVTETLPAGFTYVSSSLDASQVTETQVTVTDQKVRFTLQGETTFTYTVTASMTAGSHTFSGMLRDFERTDTLVGGDTTVTVEMDAPEPEPEPTPGDEQGQDPSASRSFSPASVAAGGRVVVTITATGYGSLGAVTETLPAGFTYVSSSLVDEGEVTEVDARTVRFTLQGADKTFTYRPEASRRRCPHIRFQQPRRLAGHRDPGHGH